MASDSAALHVILCATDLQHLVDVIVQIFSLTSVFYEVIGEVQSSQRGPGVAHQGLG